MKMSNLLRHFYHGSGSTICEKNRYVFINLIQFSLYDQIEWLRTDVS